MKRLAAVLVLIACSGSVWAQQGGMAPASAPEKGSVSGLISEAVAQYKQIKTIILASAEKMPAENFSFKPTPEVRTYAELFNHVAQAQMGMCAAPGAARPAPVTATMKEDVIAALKTSFDLCDAAYEKVSEGNLLEVNGAGYMRASQLGKIYKNVAHDNEMYGTMVVYMRLKGIVPPSTAMRGRM